MKLSKLQQYALFISAFLFIMFAGGSLDGAATAHNQVLVQVISGVGTKVLMGVVVFIIAAAAKFNDNNKPKGS